MATRSHILNDFKDLDLAPHNEIHKKLRHRRYILHKSSLWQGEYIKSSDIKDKYYRGRKKPENPLPIMLTLKGGIPYLGLLFAFMILIPVFMFVPSANTVTQKLPWLLTAVATLIKLIWSTMDCDVRMIEPFYILSRRHAPPKTLTLDYTGTIPGWLPIKALIARHWLVAVVGLGAIMTEVLTVCVSSFGVDGSKFFPGQGVDAEDPGDDRYNSDETFKSFWVSFSLAVAILFSLQAITVLVYINRRKPCLPRQPGTIASVLAYIHQSKMLSNSFVNTERLDSKKMTKHLEKSKKTYGLGWFTGRDREDHLGVDEEPLLSEYTHGFVWKDARLTTGGIGTWETYD